MLLGLTLKHRKYKITVPYWKNLFFIEAEDEKKARLIINNLLEGSRVSQEYIVEKMTVLDERSELIRHSDIRCLLTENRREHKSCVHMAHDAFFAMYHKIMIDKDTDNLKEAVYGLIKNLIYSFLTGYSTDGDVLRQKIFISHIEQETLIVDENFKFIIANAIQRSISDEESNKIIDPNASQDEKEIIIKKVTNELYNTILLKMDTVLNEIILYRPNKTIVDIYNIPIVPCDPKICKIPEITDMNEVIEYIGTHRDRIAVHDDITGIKETVWLSDLPRYKYIHWIFTFILKKKLPIALHGRDIKTSPTMRYCSHCGDVPIRECHIDEDNKYIHRCGNNLRSLCYLSEEDYNKIKKAYKIEVERT